MRPAIRLRPICAAALAATLVACGSNSPPSATRAPDADAFAGSEALVWQGVVACADCSGIDTRLRLERGTGRDAQYELVEAFLDDAGAEYFREEGRWERRGAILTLRTQSGGVRRYRIDADGALVAVGRDGSEAGEGSALAPVPGGGASPEM